MGADAGYLICFTTKDWLQLIKGLILLVNGSVKSDINTILVISKLVAIGSKVTLFRLEPNKEILPCTRSA